MLLDFKEIGMSIAIALDIIVYAVESMSSSSPIVLFYLDGTPCMIYLLNGSL